ncbi:HK97 gp10 family phage protein [Rossellomorea sp. FS2]|uniref:HK97 gp10 family phage protein n=1 Tax=Rossellomorea sp. FS2 TaxID=3391447 RepID=UPI003A4D34BE
MAKGGSVKYTITAKGAAEVMKALGAEGAKALEDRLDLIVEANAVKIANEAKENAPERDRFLKRSIKLYGKPVRLERTIGSNMPYAQRQEYEHKSKRGYFRKALWSGREPFRSAIQNEIKKLGR